MFIWLCILHIHYKTLNLLSYIVKLQSLTFGIYKYNIVITLYGYIIIM